MTRTIKIITTFGSRAFAVVDGELTLDDDGRRITGSGIPADTFINEIAGQTAGGMTNASTLVSQPGEAIEVTISEADHAQIEDIELIERLALANSNAAHLLERAWGVIANAGGWPSGDSVSPRSPGWAEAAAAWRDLYHEWLDQHLLGSPEQMTGHELAARLDAGDRDWFVQHLTGGDETWVRAHHHTDAGLVDGNWWRENLGQITLTVRLIRGLPECQDLWTPVFAEVVDRVEFAVYAEPTFEQRLHQFEGPWAKHYDAMARKTVVRAMAPFLRLGTSKAAEAVAVDEKAVEGDEFTFIDTTAEPPADTPAVAETAEAEQPVEADDTDPPAGDD